MAAGFEAANQQSCPLRPLPRDSGELARPPREAMGWIQARGEGNSQVPCLPCVMCRQTRRAISTVQADSRENCSCAVRPTSVAPEMSPPEMKELSRDRRHSHKRMVQGGIQLDPKSSRFLTVRHPVGHSNKYFLDPTLRLESHSKKI